MEHLPQHSESIQLIETIIKTLASCGMGYLGLMIGIELRGRIDGYPGAGMEMHEKFMKAIEDLFRKK